MDEWMRKGFSQFRLDAANISYRGLRYGGIALAKEKYQTFAKETPMVTDLISANAIPAKDLDKVVAPKPYVIREVSGKRFGNKSTLKVAFIGLTEPGPGEKTGFVVEEPLAKLHQIMPEVRGKADLVVV